VLDSQPHRVGLDIGTRDSGLWNSSPFLISSRRDIRYAANAANSISHRRNSTAVSGHSSPPIDKAISHAALETKDCAPDSHSRLPLEDGQRRLRPSVLPNRDRFQNCHGKSSHKIAQTCNKTSASGVVRCVYWSLKIMVILERYWPRC
jgi:hypothetical protein